jgi:hypothetical protein
LGDRLAEIIVFIMAGTFFEVLYFEVTPQVIKSLHFSLLFALFFWSLLVIIIVAIGISDLKYMIRRGLPFALGVMFFAYVAKEWYSFFIALAGFALSVILRRYVDI